MPGVLDREACCLLRMTAAGARTRSGRRESNQGVCRQSMCLEVMCSLVLPLELTLALLLRARQARSSCTAWHRTADVQGIGTGEGVHLNPGVLAGKRRLTGLLLALVGRRGGKPHPGTFIVQVQATKVMPPHTPLHASGPHAFHRPSAHGLQALLLAPLRPAAPPPDVGHQPA